MRVLAVRQPWAEEIITGRKTIEVRSRNTNIRERVAIYATGTKPKPLDMQWIGRRHRLQNITRGFIIGTVEIYDASGVHDANHFFDNLNKHLCYQDMYKKGQHFWHLRNAQRIAPVQYKMKKCTVVWGAINDELIYEEA